MSSSYDTLRLRWFGEFSRGRAFGTVFFLAFAYIGYRVDFYFFSVVSLLMLSTGYLQGWTELDLQRAQVRRTVYLFWILPVWRSTVALRQGARLCITYQPPYRDRSNRWHERDFTTIDLRYGPRDWIQLAQTERSGGDFCPAMRDRARRLTERLRIPLDERVDRVHGTQ